MALFQQCADIGHAKEAQGLLLRQFVPPICLAIALLSALILSGWAVGSPVFSFGYPDSESVKPNTAGAFLLAASSLWLLAPLKNTVRRRFVGVGLGLLVSAVGFLI